MQVSRGCFDLTTLVPLPALRTRCGQGVGMAVCTTLGLLATSAANTNLVNVFSLPCSSGLGASAGAGAAAGAAASGGLTLVCTLGSAFTPAPMQFHFHDGVSASGCLAFTGPATSRLLLVTDAGHGAVHVVDVNGRLHMGYVAAPGAVAGPRGVAARGSLVAVSAWRASESGTGVVHLFEGSGASWSAVRVVAGGSDQLTRPFGLRFTKDGSGLVVVDRGSARVSMFRVEDGSFVRHVATELAEVRDVEECEGGW